MPWFLFIAFMHSHETNATAHIRSHSNISFLLYQRDERRYTTKIQLKHTLGSILYAPGRCSWKLPSSDMWRRVPLAFAYLWNVCSRFRGRLILWIWRQQLLRNVGNTFRLPWNGSSKVIQNVGNKLSLITGSYSRRLSSNLYTKPGCLPRLTITNKIDYVFRLDEVLVHATDGTQLIFSQRWNTRAGGPTPTSDLV
jgi:hypothetical protein